MKTYSIRNTPMKILLESVYFGYKDMTLKIPAGYAFDWLSVPQLFQNIVNMNETNNIEFWAIHDYFYSEACIVSITRKDADKHLWECIWGLSGLIVYLWVRIWWAFSWKKDRNYKKYKKQIELARKWLSL